jgi:hypothetical protein
METTAMRPRMNSIAIFRALTVPVMVFVDDVSGVERLPESPGTPLKVTRPLLSAKTPSGSFQRNVALLHHDRAA